MRGQRAVGRLEFDQQPVPDGQRAQRRRGSVAALDEDLAPAAPAQQADELRVGAAKQQPRLVQQRGRVAGAAAGIAGGACLVADMDRVERRLGAWKREPGQRIEQVVRVVRTHPDQSVAGDRVFIGQRAHDRSLCERQRPAVRSGKPALAGERREPRESGQRAVPEQIRPWRKRRMRECAVLHQRPPATAITITIATSAASASSAIFHALFGYSPSMAPVTPFCTHW